MKDVCKSPFFQCIGMKLLKLLKTSLNVGLDPLKMDDYHSDVFFQRLAPVYTNWQNFQFPFCFDTTRDEFTIKDSFIFVDQCQFGC